MGRMLAWSGVALGAVYLIYVGGGWWGIYSPYLRIATMAIAAVTLAGWAVAARRNPAWRPRTVMWPAIAAVLVSLTVSTAFSRVPRVSLEYLGYTIVLVALYLLLVRLFANEFFGRRLVVLAAMLFAISSGLYVATVAAGWIEWWRLAGDLTVPPLRPGFGGLTYNNPSAALTMVALLGAPTIAAFGSSTRRGLALVAAVGCTIALVAILSGSRSGWFALGLGIPMVGVAWLSVRDNRRWLADQAATLLANPAARVALAVVAVSVIAAAVALAPGVLRRMVEGGENLRISYAVAALRMFAESPLVGTGPGTWVIQRPAMTQAGEPDYYIPHAHNLEVQALAELGVLGLAAGVVVVANIGWLLFRAIRSGDRDRRWWGWAAAIGLAYFGLHQVLDFYVNMPAFLFAAAIPVAFLDAAHPGTSRLASVAPADRAPRRVAGVIAGAAVVVAVAGLLAQELPALRQAEAVAHADARDWAAADAPAREAAALDPDVGSYLLAAGLTASRAGDHAAAASLLGRLATRDDLPEAWLNLAAEQAALGDGQAAVASLGRAMRLGEQRPAVTVPAGDLAMRLGDAALATRAFAAAIASFPALAADPWWGADPTRAALVPTLVAEAERRNPAGAWEIRLMASSAGYVEPGREAPGQGLETTIGRAWKGAPAAVHELLDACRSHPLEVELLTWCARVTAHLGDHERSDAFRSRVSLMSIGAASGTGELRVSPEGMVGKQLAGSPADLWATYTYRRPAPWDMLVPGLVHLRLE